MLRYYLFAELVNRSISPACSGYGTRTAESAAPAALCGAASLDLSLPGSEDTCRSVVPAS